jgi:hypothetical protein
VDPENDAARSDVSWPQPHPSPPLPPPREYGAPGTAPGRHPWLVGLLAVVAVAALVGAVVVVRGLVGGDDPDPKPSDPAPTQGSPTQEPTTTAPPAPAPAGATCWDGSAAESVSQCSKPEGAAGLAWVFPNLSQQKCGEPTETGPGVVLRILCVDRLTDGSRVQVGYYQWESVRAGITFYDDQGLTRADDRGVLRWTGGSGGTAKSAALYGNAPFSLTVTVRASAQPGPDDDRIFTLRPPDQLRGEPVG